MIRNQNTFCIILIAQNKDNVILSKNVSSFILLKMKKIFCLKVILQKYKEHRCRNQPEYTGGALRAVEVIQVNTSVVDILGLPVILKHNDRLIFLDPKVCMIKSF